MYLIHLLLHGTPYKMYIITSSIDNIFLPVYSLGMESRAPVVLHGWVTGYTNKHCVNSLFTMPLLHFHPLMCLLLCNPMDSIQTLVHYSYSSLESNLSVTKDLTLSSLFFNVPHLAYILLSCIGRFMPSKLFCYKQVSLGAMLRVRKKLNVRFTLSYSC